MSLWSTDVPFVHIIVLNVRLDVPLLHIIVLKVAKLAKQ